MPSERDPNAIRLPDDVAQRLLARATELDERGGRTSIDQLRRAATEAGISPAAFEAALAELARGELGRPAPGAGIDVRGPWVTSPFRRGLIVAAAAISLLVLAIGAVRMAQPDRSRPPVGLDVEAVDAPLPPPPPDVVPAPDAPPPPAVPEPPAP